MAIADVVIELIYLVYLGFLPEVSETCIINLFWDNKF